MSDTTTAAPFPQINQITRADVMDALKAGLADFKKAPAFGLFFGAVFSIMGMIILAQLWVWESGYWVIPLACGFPFIGPFAAVGLYEVSRRLEAGEPLDWSAILTVVARERHRQIPSMAFVAIFFLLIWMYLSHLVFALSFGTQPLTNVTSSMDFLFTGRGITMLIVGTLVGGAMALLFYAISVVSFPMFLERELDVVTGMIASFQAVTLNKGPMLFWAAILAALSILAMIPLFLAMIFVFPILGHASWHLYRKVIVPEG